MLNKKIIRNGVILLMLSMCRAMSMVAPETEEETPVAYRVNAFAFLFSTPPSVLIVCRHLSLLHMTMPAITASFVGITIGSMIWINCVADDDNDEAEPKSLSVLLGGSLVSVLSTIIICFLFALITYLTSFNCALILPALYMIASIQLWFVARGDCMKLLKFLGLCILLIIAFNYAGFYIAQLIW